MTKKALIKRAAVLAVAIALSCVFVFTIVGCSGNSDDGETAGNPADRLDDGVPVKMYVTDATGTYAAGYDEIADAFVGAKKQIATRDDADVTIMLDEGTYAVDETIAFNGYGIEGKNYSLTIVGANADKTVVTSNYRFDGDHVDDLGFGYYAYTLPDSLKTDGEFPAYRELFADGEALTMARSDDYNLPLSLVKYKEDGSTLVDHDDRVVYVEEDYLVDKTTGSMIDVSDLSGAELWIKDVWDLEVLRIESCKATNETYNNKMLYALRINDDDWNLLMNEAGSSVNLSSSSSNTMLQGKCCWIQNSLEFLTEDYSFIYDRENGQFVFRLEDGVEPYDMEFSFPALDTLMSFENVSNVSIYNVGFTGASNLSVGDEGYICGQAGVQRSLSSENYKNFQPYAAIHGEDVSNFGVYGCEFKDIGVDGVSFCGAVDDVEISYNEFYNIGGTAIRCADAYGNQTALMYSEEEHCKNLTITNNYIDGVGIYWLSNPAIQIGHVQNLDLTYNTIKNSSYTGISVGWGWAEVSDVIVNIYNAEIAYNYIDSFMTEMQDGGAIYVMGGNASPSYEGYFNRMHDNCCVVCEDTGKVTGIANNVYSCYYLDASSTNWEEYNNVVLANGLNTPRYGYFYLQYISGQQIYNCHVYDNFIVDAPSDAEVLGGDYSDDNEFGLIAENNIMISSADLDTLYQDVAQIVSKAGCDMTGKEGYEFAADDYTLLGDDSNIVVDETRNEGYSYVYHEILPTTSGVFDVDVSETGVYEIAFKYTASTETFYGGVVNASAPYIKSFNHQSASETFEDGYNKTVYYAYLLAGETNRLTFTASEGTVEISGYRLAFVKRVDEVANFGIEGSTSVGGGFMTAIRLVQKSNDQITVETTLDISQSGYYDLSYFGSAANSGEINVTLTGNGQTINMSSVAFAWETQKWVIDGMTDGVNKTYHICLFTENLYVVDDKNPKLTINNKYVWLDAGTYTVSATAPRVTSSSQVYIGGAIFATLVG